MIDHKDSEKTAKSRRKVTFKRLPAAYPGDNAIQVLINGRAWDCIVKNDCGHWVCNLPGFFYTLADAKRECKAVYETV